MTISGTQSANGLYFQSAGDPTLSGTGTILLGGDGISVPQYAYGTVSQGSVSITSPIALQAAECWVNSSSNSLSIGGPVSTAGNLLTISGPGNTIISGAMSGSGGLAKFGIGLLTLTATNTYSGGTTVTAGTLQLGTGGSGQDGALSASGGIVDNATVSYESLRRADILREHQRHRQSA